MRPIAEQSGNPRLSAVRLCQRNLGEGLFVKSTETDIKI
jgi:hypothetical protein